MTERQYTAESLGAEMRYRYGYGTWKECDRDTFVRVLDHLASTAIEGTYGYQIANWYESATDKAVFRLINEVIRTQR